MRLKNIYQWLKDYQEGNDKLIEEELTGYCSEMAASNNSELDTQEMGYQGASTKSEVDSETSQLDSEDMEYAIKIFTLYLANRHINSSSSASLNLVVKTLKSIEGVETAAMVLVGLSEEDIKEIYPIVLAHNNPEALLKAREFLGEMSISKDKLATAFKRLVKIKNLSLVNECLDDLIKYQKRSINLFLCLIYLASFKSLTKSVWAKILEFDESATKALSRLLKRITYLKDSSLLMSPPVLEFILNQVKSRQDIETVIFMLIRDGNFSETSVSNLIKTSDPFNYAAALFFVKFAQIELTPKIFEQIATHPNLSSLKLAIEDLDIVKQLSQMVLDFLLTCKNPHDYAIALHMLHSYPFLSPPNNETIDLVLNHKNIQSFIITFRVLFDSCEEIYIVKNINKLLSVDLTLVSAALHKLQIAKLLARPNAIVCLQDPYFAEAVRGYPAAINVKPLSQAWLELTRLLLTKSIDLKHNPVELDKFLLELLRNEFDLNKTSVEDKVLSILKEVDCPSNYFLLGKYYSGELFGVTADYDPEKAHFYFIQLTGNAVFGEVSQESLLNLKISQGAAIDGNEWKARTELINNLAKQNNPTGKMLQQSFAYYYKGGQKKWANFFHPTKVVAENWQKQLAETSKTNPANQHAFDQEYGLILHPQAKEVTQKFQQALDFLKINPENANPSKQEIVFKTHQATQLLSEAMHLMPETVLIEIENLMHPIDDNVDSFLLSQCLLNAAKAMPNDYQKQVKELTEALLNPPSFAPGM